MPIKKVYGSLLTHVFIVSCSKRYLPFSILFNYLHLLRLRFNKKPRRKQSFHKMIKGKDAFSTRVNPFDELEGSKRNQWCIWKFGIAICLPPQIAVRLLRRASLCVVSNCFERFAVTVLLHTHIQDAIALQM